MPDDYEALNLKIKADPKYGNLKAMVSVALEDVLAEDEQKRAADKEKDDAEGGIIDTILGVFGGDDKKSRRK